MEYLYHILIFILLYAVIVQSLNLIKGYVGIISMCHAIFVGIGAYTAALIGTKLGYNFILSIVIGFFLAAVIGALLATPSLRVKNEYIIVFTIGFQMVMYEFMLTARGITEGQGGIPGIPPPSLFGFEFDTPLKYIPLSIAVTIFCFAIAWRIINSPFGRVLKAIREDEEACRAIGKNSLRFKVLVFAVGGGIAAIAGVIMAYYISFVSPFNFSVDVSIFIIVMVVLGGVANFWGPLVGAAVLVGLPEVLRFIPGAAGIIDAIREVLYGLILMLLMIFRPQGILPEYAGTAGSPKNRPDHETDDESPAAGLETLSAAGDAAHQAGEAVLTIERLSKSFGGLKAVNEVDLELARGQITGLIGPNGCGKTTIFNLVTGYLKPDAGHVFVNGQNVTSDPPYKLVEKGLARSWQDVRVFNKMTVMDNVMVACPNQSGERLIDLFFHPVKVLREKRLNYKKAKMYIDLVGLSENRYELAVNLSAAEQKLVAIARLLATECQVLLLDEPTSALDVDSVDRIIRLIKRISETTKRTILLVEHNLDVVRGLVQDAYFMSEGKVIARGKPQELMNDPKLSEVYFGID